jgi:hypothetical protein
MPAEHAHVAKEHQGATGVFREFFRSFKPDVRFLKIWGLDTLFWLCVALICVFVAASYADVMQSIETLQQNMGEQMAQAAWSSLTHYVAVLAAMLGVVFVLFVVFQAFLWRVLVPQRITAGLLARFAVFVVLAMPVIAVFAAALFYLLAVFSTLTLTTLQSAAVVVLPLLFVVFLILMLPLIVWPWYGFFKEARIWRGLGRGCWAGLTTVPSLWPHYLLAAIVLAIVATVWALVTMLDFWIGTFAGAVLLAGPALAWLRLYLVGLIEKHEQC